MLQRANFCLVLALIARFRAWERLPDPLQAVHHGQGAQTDEADIARDRFFRAIDRAILEHHFRPSGLPLMLATLAEYHTPACAVSHNPFLMSDGISLNCDDLSLDQLRAEAWQEVEPLYFERLAKRSGWRQKRGHAHHHCKDNE